MFLIILLCLINNKFFVNTPLKIALKKTVSIFILFTYFTVTFNLFVPVLGYYVFLDYIVNELCVQKDFEENLCMGQCHLKKQIEQQAETENKSEQKGSLPKTENHSPHYVNQLLVKIISGKPDISYCYFQLKLKTHYSQPLIPPPKLFI